MSFAYHKLIFTGPVGAGKTTAISTISDIPVVSTEAIATDETAKLKKTTTVAMDYGVMNLQNGTQVHLYGTPGQARFDFMWDILTEGGIGLILLVSNNAPDPISDVQQFVRHFADFIAETAIVIGVTQTDITAEPSIEQYYDSLANEEMQGYLPTPPPIFSVDARNSADVKMMVEALLYALDPELVN